MPPRRIKKIENSTNNDEDNFPNIIDRAESPVVSDVGRTKGGKKALAAVTKDANNDKTIRVSTNKPSTSRAKTRKGVGNDELDAIDQYDDGQSSKSSQSRSRNKKKQIEAPVEENNELNGKKDVKIVRKKSTNKTVGNKQSTKANEREKRQIGTENKKKGNVANGVDEKVDAAALNVVDNQEKKRALKKGTNVNDQSIETHDSPTPIVSRARRSKPKIDKKAALAIQKNGKKIDDAKENMNVNIAAVMTKRGKGKQATTATGNSTKDETKNSNSTDEILNATDSALTAKRLPSGRTTKKTMPTRKYIKIGRKKMDIVPEEKEIDSDQHDVVANDNHDANLAVVPVGDNEENAEIKKAGTKRKQKTSKKKTDENEDEGVEIEAPTAAKRKTKTSVISVKQNKFATDFAKLNFDLLDTGDNNARKKEWNFKISTWNVAGLRALTDKGGMELLEYEKPDVFCMQEIKCISENVPEMAKIKGYHTYWHSTPGGHGGVALYTKTMPYNVDYGLGDEEQDKTGRIITAEFMKFYLISVYVPNAGRKLVNLDKRMRWDELFQQHLLRLNEKKPVIVCGDLNVAHEEIDLANPKTNKRSAGFTQEERDGMTKMLSLGFVDTFRQLYPERTKMFTYWTYMGNSRSKNVGWRLDYFIVSERFWPKVVDNVIRSDVYGSDHCPITLFLNV